LNDPRRVAHIDRDRHQFHQLAKSLFALSQNFFGPFTLDDIDHASPRHLPSFRVSPLPGLLFGFLAA
jgi:hypothetical protein